MDSVCLPVVALLDPNAYLLEQCPKNSLISAWPPRRRESRKDRSSRECRRTGRVGDDALTERAVWQLVREYAAQVGIGELPPHDLRRCTAAKLCRFGQSGRMTASPP
jgi:hypothetical protein